MSRTSQPKIIAFSGKIGSGKNYLSENIVFDYLRKKNKNVLIVAFADYLKTMCHVKDRILYERLFYDKDIESRKALQNRGILERNENPNIFIEVLDCTMRTAFDRKVDVIIVSDLRFKNEFKFLKDMGALLVRVNSPKRTKDKLISECGDDKKSSIVASHISEVDLDDCKEFDYYISNDYENKDNVIVELKNILDSYFS